MLNGPTKRTTQVANVVLAKTCLFNEDSIFAKYSQIDSQIKLYADGYALDGSVPQRSYKRSFVDIAIEVEVLH